MVSLLMPKHKNALILDKGQKHAGNGEALKSTNVYKSSHATSPITSQHTQVHLQI